MRHAFRADKLSANAQGAAMDLFDGLALVLAATMIWVIVSTWLAVQRR
ncbi:hypothetical protein [Methylobacterium nigriterrae]